MIRTRCKERFYRWLCWRLPRRLIYWTAIRLWAHGTTGPYADTVAPELTVGEALARWEAHGLEGG